MLTDTEFTAQKKRSYASFSGNNIIQRKGCLIQLSPSNSTRYDYYVMDLPIINHHQVTIRQHNKSAMGS